MKIPLGIVRAGRASLPACLTFSALALGSGGCTSAQGPVRDASAPPRAQGGMASRWVGPTRVPLLVEPNAPARDFAALEAVLAFWGRGTGDRKPVDHVRPRAPEEPLLALDIERVARAAGLSAFAFHGTLEDVVYELQAGRPVIVGVSEAAPGARPHYEVVVACDPGARRLKNLDPARGFVERTYSGFEEAWGSARKLTLVMFEDPETLAAASPPAPRPHEHVARR